MDTMWQRILTGLLVLLILRTPVATVALAATPAPEERPGYTLQEDTTVTEEAPPLAATPEEQACCALHPLLMLAALLVTVYYTHDRKQRQAREYELRFSLLEP